MRLRIGRIGRTARYSRDSIFHAAGAIALGSERLSQAREIRPQPRWCCWRFQMAGPAASPSSAAASYASSLSSSPQPATVVLRFPLPPSSPWWAYLFIYFTRWFLGFLLIYGGRGINYSRILMIKDDFPFSKLELEILVNGFLCY